MKIVLDPSLIWFDPDSSDDFQYLCDVVEFVNTYIDLQYFASTRFINYLLHLASDPMKGYRESEQRKHEIISLIWKGLDIDNIFNAEQDFAVTLPDSFELPDRTDLKGYVNEIFGIAATEKTELLMFLAIKNHKCSVCNHLSIIFVKHIYKELESYIGKMFSDGTNVKNGCLVSPSCENPLPNANLCKEYSKIRVDLIRAGQGDKPNFKKIGREVAFRNCYVLDEYLTKINNDAIREIFRSQTRSIIYLSTDTEHGAFEAFDEHGRHLGEFSYEGKKTQNASREDHTIKLKR